MSEKAMIRMRMSMHDAHYGGNLVDGAKMLNLFGDVATELLIRQDGDEGLFAAYEKVEFLAPVYAGDYIEAVGEITHVGNSSRKMVFEARKVIIPRPDLNESACDVLEEPIVVCRAVGTCVVPKNKQRKQWWAMEKLIITAALTGAEVTRAQQPNLPLTPDEIAQDAFECYEAGASIVHIHARDAAGEPTQDMAVYKEIKEKIEAKCNIIFQPSTGGAVWHTPEQRLQPVDLAPEMATLSCGTCNFGPDVFMNSEEYIEKFAEKMQVEGVKPEVEVFERGMIENAKRLVKKGLLKSPVHVDFVLGVPGACPGTPEDLMYMVSCLPEGWTWTVAGIGRSELPLAVMAIVLGGHVRVGFEDNVYYGKGELAKSNAQLVERIVRIAKEMGREVATPDEARAILGLK